MRKFLIVLMLGMMLLGVSSVEAKKKNKFTLAVSIYAGWMPWYYANQEEIIQKHAKENGIEVEVVYMDYIASIEAFVAGQADACVMTNMEALNMPAASGIDSSVVIIGDYSNGNDALLVRDVPTVKDLKGEKIFLVELSVSHYMLSRALNQNGLKEADVEILNVSDSDIGPAFLADKSQKAVVTWNPIVMNLEQDPSVSRLFDSSKIPGEILDLCVGNTKTLNDNPAFAKTLVATWYEVMGTMSKRGPEANAAMEKMAALAGCSTEEYKAQLRTTAMFWTPDKGIDYAKGSEIKEKMDFVRNFCFEHGLLGEGADSVDIVGIEYPDGSVQGDKNNVKLRFTTKYMELAK